MNRLKITLVAAVALASTVNVFNANKSETLSDMALANVEALAGVEYDGECVEWADKNCWRSDQFSKTHGTDYYATCSGESTAGGKRECGAVSSYLPLSPYNSGTCLQCVATVNDVI